MKILICHERFVFRFGVDRVLLALAREFRLRGHHVTLLGMTFDATSSSGWADRVVCAPSPSMTMAADAVAVEWLAENWEATFGGDAKPEIVLTAGWPFVATIPVFESHGCPVVFQDHGIIPSDGMPEIGWRTLALLEELKRVFLPEASAVVAVSQFIREQQSLPLARPGQRVEVIPNGVDHGEVGMWGPPTSGAMPVLPARDSRSALRILCPGRFEPGTYKQSELIFALEARVRAWAPGAWIGVFATGETIAAAAGSRCESAVVPLGHPSDGEMARLVEDCDLVVCFSRWEGFNLSLAEAQVLGRPCLVFNIGAHPEVVADPWLLCADLDDMAEKVRAIADGTAPARLLDGTALRGWTEGRRWRDIAVRYLDLFAALRAAGTQPRIREVRSLSGGGDRNNGAGRVIMDVTNAVRDPSNSGCVRVTRRLAAEWQAYLAVIFVVWERAAEAFRFPTAEEFVQLGTFRGPTHPAGHPVSETGRPVFLWAWLNERRGAKPGERDERRPRGWLVLPEIRHRPDLWPILEFAARAGLQTASIFHDAIPVHRPDLVPDPTYREGHADYMRGLSRVDISIANSRASAVALQEFWREERLSGRVTSCLLPGGLAGERPRAGAARDNGPGAAGEAPFLLMVSTLEPRKGFRRLIEAFLAVRDRAGRQDWRLVLVGGRSWWSGDIAAFVEATVSRHVGVSWLENASDDRLSQLYRECAFTVYASEIEGFGLPIMESIWHGRPCLCHNAGVMRELAAGGGCLTADLLDPAEFESSLLRLMDDAALRHHLAEQCRARSVKRWADFAAEFWDRLACARWAELESSMSDVESEPVGEAIPGRLSFIIPTYNRLDLLQVCLETLVATLPAALDTEILVVDDASGDGTRDWLRHAEAVRQGVRVLRNTTNRGYGTSVNRAARLATGEILVLLNHDLRFRAGWLEPMLEVWRGHRRPFAVGNLQYAARDGSLDHAGIVFDASGHPEHFRPAQDPAGVGGSREFPAITFACALVDRRRFLDLAGFDAHFLNGFEDVDLCLRARFQGWPCRVANASAVEHQVSATPGRKLAEAENRHRFFARWQQIAIVLGRDWEERLAWERCGGAGMPDDTRRPGPWRVLVDLTPFAGESGGRRCADVVQEASRLPRAGEGRTFVPVLLMTPEQHAAIESTGTGAGGGDRWPEVWFVREKGDDGALPAGVRALGGPAITVARRLEADVLFAPAGTSAFVSPDVPTLVPGAPVGAARSGHASHTLFHGAVPRSARLEERLAEAIEAFTSAGVTWRWTGAGVRPAAGDAARKVPARTVDSSLDRIRCCIDEPVRWEEPVRMVEIRGWCLHLDGVPLTEIALRTVNGDVCRGVMGRSRPDVAAAFPGVATAATSGFSIRIPEPTETLQLWVRGGAWTLLREWRVGRAVPG